MFAQRNEPTDDRHEDQNHEQGQPAGDGDKIMNWTVFLSTFWAFVCVAVSCAIKGTRDHPGHPSRIINLSLSRGAFRFRTWGLVLFFGILPRRQKFVIRVIEGDIVLGVYLRLWHCSKKPFRLMYAWII